MPLCQLCGNKCKVDRFDKRLLEGDVFYDYYCADCSNTKDGTFERHQLSWQTVIHLVLYHLQTRLRGQTGRSEGFQPKFFRWKEDICGFIEDHWDDLIPQKNPGVSWQNSVSSVLSAHHDVFLNGLEIKGETGWWALKSNDPPKLKQSNNNQASNNSLTRPRRAMAEEDVEIKSEAGSLDLMLEEEEEEGGGGGDETKADKEGGGRATTATAKGESMSQSETKPSGPSEMIKKQLLSRLLSEDSSLIQAALHKVKEDQQQQQQQQQQKAIAASPEFNSPRSKSRATVTRVPPIENELLRILSRIKNPDCKMKRLRRKLLARRERRRVGMDLFDLDAFMYNYLKEPRPFDINGNRIDLISSNNGATLSKHPSNDQLITVKTPYEGNKYLSMKCKVLGISACVSGFPFEITSPFTGRPLPEYIHKDPDSYVKSPKGQVLCSLKRLFDQKDSGTIDYVHIRQEYVGQLNRLLSTFFWPGIDVTESLSYPDYSILAVYNAFLIVGAALLDPEGYLSYLFVHPDFSGAGIGSKLLHFVLQSAPPRDITLHVSATNPAMLLYNRLGFKPEQYIVNHYDQYFRIAQQNEQSGALSALLPYSKNAFLMRLRR